jgi:PucR-like helix-turn-helix protein
MIYANQPVKRDLSQQGSTSGGVHRFKRDADAEAEAALERIQAVLRRDEERFVDAIQAAIREQLPALESVPDAALRDSIRFDYHRALGALDGAGDKPVDAAGAERVLGACTAEQLAAARRVGVRCAWELLGADPAMKAIDEATRLEGLYAIWAWADAIQAEESAVRWRAELRLAGAGAGEDDRSWFLRALLHGTLSADDLRSRGTAYGILPSARYFAFRARPSAGADKRELAREIQSSGGEDGFGVLAGTLDGDVCGVVSRMPRVTGEGIVGIGFEAEVPRVADSFGMATRALETAAAFGLEGVVTIDDLSLRPAVLAESHLGDRLVRRYLEPLTALGEFGATVEETVRAYLGHGMRIDESARALYVHPNTLRHRLDRFQQLTGADLRKTQDVLELWWALERRRLASVS